MSSIIALDVGEKRIGVALASMSARLASPQTTLGNTSTVLEEIGELVANTKAELVVVGLPRNMNNEDTAQTAYVRNFADKLADKLSIPLVFYDEADSSRRAKGELSSRKKPYEKGEVDALAATYVLQDYLDHQKAEAARG